MDIKFCSLDLSRLTKMKLNATPITKCIYITIALYIDQAPLVIFSPQCIAMLKNNLTL